MSVRSSNLLRRHEHPVSYVTAVTVENFWCHVVLAMIFLTGGGWRSLALPYIGLVANALHLEYLLH